MTATADPKRTRDEFGVLAAPRFVPGLPARQSGDQGRSAAVRALIPSLRERANQWAAVCETEKSHQSGNVMSAFRKGRFGPPAHFETAMRRNPETRRFVLYVRYVGPTKR